MWVDVWLNTKSRSAGQTDKHNSEGVRANMTVSGLYTY